VSESFDVPCTSAKINGDLPFSAMSSTEKFWSFCLMAKSIKALAAVS